MYWISYKNICQSDHVKYLPVVTHRDTELDGLRGLAVCMVLGWHFIGIPAWSTDGLLAHLLFRVFLFGGAGVDLFFVLSGFLITRIIISRKQQNIKFLVVFYARRALRILPPYLLLLGVFYGVGAIVGHNEVFNEDVPAWRFLTFTQNFWMSEHATYGPSGASVTWSVAIEEQYYLFFPFLAIVLPKNFLSVFLIAIAIGSIAWRAYIFNLDPANSFPMYLGTFARLDGLCAGGLIACALDDPSFTKWLRNHMVGLRRTALSMVIAALMFVRRDSAHNMAYIGHTLLCLCFMFITLYIVLNLGGDLKSMRFLRTRFLRFLGRISYSVYLFHPIVLASAFLITGYSKTLSGLPQVIILTLCLVFSIIVSNLLFVLFESKFISLGRKMPY